MVDKDFDGNILYATRHYSGEDKARNEFSAGNINWIAGEPPGSGGSGAKHSKVPLKLEHLRIKVRHGAESHAAVVTLTEGGKKAHVQLKERDKGLAPGQFAARCRAPPSGRWRRAARAWTTRVPHAVAPRASPPAGGAVGGLRTRVPC